MALVNVQHKAVTGKAKQFDGSMAAITDILSGRPTANITLTCTYDSAGALVRLRVTGGAFGDVAVGLTDWVVFPTDTALPARAVTNAEATTDWQVV